MPRGKNNLWNVMESGTPGTLYLNKHKKLFNIFHRASEPVQANLSKIVIDVMI
jgi:hypothetical protein